MLQVIKIIIAMKSKNVIGLVAENLNKRYEDRMILKKAQELYEGSIEDEKILNIIDSLFERSGLKKIVPFFTTELLIICTLGFSAYVSVIVYIKFHFWLYTASAFVIVIFVVISLLSFMSKLTYNKIDNQIVVYIDTLKNLAKTNSDIVTIFEKSLPYAKGPLKDYVRKFVFESKRGVPLDRALKNFKNKVESKRLKELISNLSISADHNANYENLFEKVKILFERHDYFKKKRQSIARVGRIGIVCIVALGGYILHEMQQINGNNISMVDMLRGSFIGNFLLIYCAVVLVIALYIFLTLDKVND